ncbi:MAG: hypothetical protein J6B05_01930, partial [Clostridia bacterium]|nr:hypothetical protein [Clostridia bacterium]
MKDSIKNRKKKFLALCLSAMMLTSIAALGACKDGSETDSSTTSSSSASTSAEKDTGLIKNAGFETFDEKNAINTSATGWSRSVNSTTSGSALSSKAASGIIDLEPTAWNNLTGTNANYNVATMTEEEAEKAWEHLTVKDKLAYYDRWKKENKDGTISKDLSFYESFNIDSGDIPTIQRFDTHHKEGEEGYGEDTKVLMIHNEYPESDSTATYKALGTAQKYTSSSTVVVKAGTSAEFSVWVKTQDLQSSSTEGTPQPAVNKGAYISVTHSVGGKALDAYTVENINTENMDQGTLSNGWKQYTFILKGSSYVDTTFSVVLGLGQGGGTYRGEYVNGYAFFDDIKCDVISNASFTDKLAEYSINASDVVGFADEGEAKIVDVAKTENVDKTKFALDFYGDFSTVDVLAAATGKATTSEVAGETVSSVKGQNPAKWLGEGFDATKDVTAVFDNAAAIKTAADSSNNEYLSAIYTNYFENNNFAKDKKTLLLMSANGAAYTADSNYNFQFKNPVTSEEVEYLAISFFVKTSDLNGYTGAGITLVDGNNKTSFSSIDTSSIAPVEIEENKDVYEGWQQCFFFVENASDDAATTFTLSFNLGPTAIEEGTSKDSYHPGFAAFTDFKVYSMTKDEYESAQSGTYAKLVSVKGAKKDETKSENGFDNVAGVPSDAIETGLANLQNYKGVYSNSAYITGALNDSKEYNKHENAGLISKEHFTSDTGYFSTSTSKWLTGLKTVASSATTASEVWNTVFGKDSTRPLLIWNDGSESGKAYGYIGNSTNIPANTYTAVSLRVKVSAGAKASIYLIDTDQDKYDTTLSIGRNLTFWYDDNGNVCTGDPSEKSTQVAFKLQTNGLYIANKNWDGYNAETMDGVWFANLNAYATDSLTGNKLVAEGGASHNYDNYWNNEGLDGIAYYYNKDNQTYYADRAKTIPVSNLADVAGLAHRFEAIGAENQKLSATVEDTKGEWKYVTFYIHTGDTAKNYRLEVWSGDRTGAGNAENSYVIFDAYNPGEAESNFTGLLEEFKDKVDDANKFEGVFSYFDTAMYLRYNSKLDTNKIGNLYEDNYTPTAQTEGIAYLKHDTTEELTIFADYQYSEKAVTASTPETDDDKEDSTEETKPDT